jgi:hypothetical protein
MTLDDIHKSIHSGTNGIQDAINLVLKYMKKSTLTEQKLSRIRMHVFEANDLFKTLPSGFLNRLNMPGMIGNYVKKYDAEHLGNKEINTIFHTVQLINYIEDQLNKEIIHAKQPSTKLNRQKEKQWVMEYMRVNRMSFDRLYSLYNKFLEIKDEINAA